MYNSVYRASFVAVSSRDPFREKAGSDLRNSAILLAASRLDKR